jgi:hypothetical protein
MAASKARGMPFSQWVQESLDNKIIAEQFYGNLVEMRERMIAEGLYTPPDNP